MLKLDIEHFFETLSHGVMRRLLRRRLGHDARLMALVERFIDAGAPGAAPGRGVPIGNLTSQHFGNFYLGPLDRHLSVGLRAPFVRYMDDILVFGGSRGALWEVARGVEAFVGARLDLKLKARVTEVMPTRCGVPFLGFRVFGHLMAFDNARRRRFIRRLRAVEAAVARGGDEAAAQASASSLVGWADHGSTRALRRALVGAWAAADGKVRWRGGSNRVNRGGSWNNNAQNARAGNRNNNTPSNRNNNLGFRLCSTEDAGESPLWAGVGASTDSPRESVLRPFAASPEAGPE